MLAYRGGSRDPRFLTLPPKSQKLSPSEKRAKPSSGGSPKVLNPRSATVQSYIATPPFSPWRRGDTFSFQTHISLHISLSCKRPCGRLTHNQVLSSAARYPRAAVGPCKSVLLTSSEARFARTHERLPPMQQTQANSTFGERWKCGMNGTEKCVSFHHSSPLPKA